MNGPTCSKPSFETKFKVSIIGTGNVGATAAHSLLLSGIPTELVLYARKKSKAKGLAMDFEHSLAMWDYTKITPTDNFADCKGSDIVVITSGARQLEGETRLDLVEKNKAIFKQIIPPIAKAAPNAILLIVSNPVDVLTYEAIKLSGFPANRVFGSGTMLDTARFQFHIAKHLCVNPKSVDAYILGEHGDTSFPTYSSADVGGKPLTEFEGFTEKIMEECYKDTQQAAYRIINDLGYTCYSIASVIREIVANIYHHAKVVVPLSVKLDNFYGHSDVCLSVPCILDSTGIAGVINIPLDKKEQKMLANAVKTLKPLQS